MEQAFAAVGVTVRREDVLTWLETVRKSWRLVMGYCGGAIQVLAAVPGVVRGKRSSAHPRLAEATLCTRKQLSTATLACVTGSREALVATLEPNIAVDGAAQVNPHH